MVAPPGERVRVQVPVAGSPVSSTLPVATEQVGWVIVPTTGGEGGVCTVSIVGAKPCRKENVVPDTVPTDISPSVQVKEPPVKVDFSPALAMVCLLNVGCPPSIKVVSSNNNKIAICFINFI